MIDLTKKSLPNTVRLNGRDFSVYTDYRVWMRFETDLKKNIGKPFSVDYLFKNNHPLYIRIPDLFAFSRPKNILPREMRSSHVIALDYELDSDYIYAAFFQQYGIDLIDIPELHWHKFLALLRGLKGTKLDEIMGYRFYQKETRKDLDPYEILRDAWMIEPPMSEEDQAELDEFSKTFGGT